MDCPTFGTAENHLAKRVQSLDRKGDFKMSDRNKVLISRAPTRHRSITAINFYAAPPSRTTRTGNEPPPRPPRVPAPFAAPQRPPPRFLELFKPLTTDEVPISVTHSGTSTPCSEMSPSQPVTPHNPSRCLPIPARHGPPSYFPCTPRKRQNIEIPRSIQPNAKVNYAASEQQHQHDSSSDEWDEDDEDVDVDYPTIHHSVYIRERDEWPEREIPTSGLDMVAGTFGRA